MVKDAGSKSGALENAKLIFNPTAGEPEESPGQLMEIIEALQAQAYNPEVFLIQPDFDIAQMVQDALKRGVRMFVVSGGDGTVESVAAHLVKTRATLAIIPTGTQNNVALSLGVPLDIAAAVALLRNGRRISVDVGVVASAHGEQRFLEICSVGLLSALFPAADGLQRGNFVRIGELLATFFSSIPAEIQLKINRRKPIVTQGHVLLVSNMPYIGANYLVAEHGTYDDGLLDVMVFPDLTKLQLLGSAWQMVGMGWEDERVQHFRVRRMEVTTRPEMPIMVDGQPAGQGALTLRVQRKALNMVAGLLPPAEFNQAVP